MIRRSLIAALALMSIAAPTMAHANNQTIYVPIQVKNYSGFAINDFEVTITQSNWLEVWSDSFSYIAHTTTTTAGSFSMPPLFNGKYQQDIDSSGTLRMIAVPLSGGSAQVTITVSGHYILANGQTHAFDTGAVPYTLYADDDGVFVTLTLMQYARPFRAMNPAMFPVLQNFGFNIYSNETCKTNLFVAQ